MVNYVKSAVEIISADLSKYAYLIVIILVLSSAIVFLIELLACIFSHKKRDTAYYLCFAVLNATLTSYFAIEDYLGEKFLFEKVKSVYAVMTAVLSLLIIFYMILRLVSTLKKPKKVARKVEDINQKQLFVERVKTKPYERYNSDDVVSGYLDVTHVKSLIEQLKSKELSENDYGQIEDLELYLLNFVSRQPNQSERAVLSEKLSMLIKKIALYAS